MLDINKVSKNIKNKINFRWLIITVVCVVITYCSVNGKAINNYKTILQIASENCNLEVVKFSVENLLDVNTQIPKVTALHYASGSGCLEVVNLLVERRADLHAAGGYENWTPLHYAADEGHLEVVKFLLKREADPTATAKDGRRTRNMAVWELRYDKNKDKPYDEIIKLLYDAEQSYKADK